MHVLDANEIFGMTFYTYDRILEEGGKIGPDALALYVKLIKQTRIQQTNQTKSLDSFLEEGLGWGYKRLRNAKDVLKGLGLIDSVEVRDTLGKIVGHYVRVNFLINEQKVRTANITYNLSTTYSESNVAEGHLWPNEHKCLNNININAGSTKLKKESKKIPSVSELVEAYKNDEILPRKLDDEKLVRERAEYKQAKKERAYKTTKGFLQQLNVCIDTVRFGGIRGDTQPRFAFALNQAMEREWKSMYWTEQTELEYQSWKKTLAIMNK